MGTLVYSMNNSWVHKGIKDTVVTYYNVIEESQDKHIHHDFVEIGNLLNDALRKY